jgi:DNA invertase Pin-like site-specific DNA recombinase
MPKTSAYVYVRISTEKQRKGEGLRRQTERAQQYAIAHNLELHTREYHDVGVSAFKGKNVDDGELGEFIHAMESGEIPKGSFLLVESLDRLSRAGVYEAFGLLTRIVKGGVTVVTLLDGQQYHSEPAVHEMMISLSIMMRAHDESKSKSLRHKHNWEKKRLDIANKKMTATCPHWLTLSGDGKSFVIDKKRAAIVASIFEDAVGGLGVGLIAKKLNESGTPAWGRTDGWRDSYIKKMLSGLAVRGHIEVTHWEGVQRTKKIIEDYYPRIISEDLYFRAQQALQSRRGKGGRKGKQIQNF